MAEKSNDFWYPTTPQKSMKTPEILVPVGPEHRSRVKPKEGYFVERLLGQSAARERWPVLLLSESGSQVYRTSRGVYYTEPWGPPQQTLDQPGRAPRKRQEKSEPETVFSEVM